VLPSSGPVVGSTGPNAHRLPEFIYAKVCEQKKDRWEIAAAAVMSA